MKKEQPIAVLTINRAGDMTPLGKKEAAEWLRHCARLLLKEGSNYSVKFVARYMGTRS